MRKLVPLALLAPFLFLTACEKATQPSGPDADASAAGAAVSSGHIVLLDAAAAPGGHAANQAAAASVARDLGLSPDHLYGTAVFGFSAPVAEGRVAVVERDPRVTHVEAVEAWELAAQELPTGVDRTEADQNANADIDGSDDARVPYDLAIIDTGIDLDHPDLNVAGAVSFSGGDGDDGNGHGSHVAGSAAAIDNSEGVVGMAPGAALYAVQVCKAGGICLTSDIVAGIDWVADRKAESNDGDADGDAGIDFAGANMSISTSDEGFECSEGDADAVHQAICGAVNEGVVFTLAAGNDSQEKTAYPEAFAVSAIADFDGKGGGAASPTCRDDEDETLANFSNFGSTVDVAAPGVCIRSTWKDGGYNTISGTSMAAPHALGAVALYLHANDLAPATDATGVDNIEASILDAALPEGTANHECSYDNEQGATTPMLFVNDQSVFNGSGACDVVSDDGGGDGSMYVWDIAFSQKDYGPGGSFHDLMTTVTIQSDSDGDGTAESSDDPVSDASVGMTLTHDTDGDGTFECGTDDDCWSFSGTTDTGGEVTFTLKRASTGDYKAEVTDLTHSSFTWDPTLDADNPDFYTLQ